MKVLLAIDDDKPSRDAARATASWLPNEATIVALHVAPDPATVATPPVTGHFGAPGAGGIVFRQEILDGLRDDTELEAMASKVADETLAPDHTRSVVVEHGDPATVICRVATEIDADLIVVGTGDRSWLDRLLEPSVSREVSTAAPCSVLVVR